MGFIGGRGRVRNYHHESVSWFYRIEMVQIAALGFGRIGGETVILLPELDVSSFMASYINLNQFNVVLTA